MTILDITTFSNDELLDELKRRTNTTVRVNNSRPTPYQVLTKMMESGNYKEDSRQGYSNPRIDAIWDYIGYPKLTDDNSWCAATLNCALKLCGYKMSAVPPVARSFADYGDKVDSKQLRRGDIVVLAKIGSDWQGHVGLYENSSSNSLTLLGGNQSNQVKISQYIMGDSYTPLDIRRITNDQVELNPDWKTLEEWGLL